MKKNHVGVVGATGLVGRTMLKVLEERNFPVGALNLYASERSTGKKLTYRGEDYVVQSIAQLLENPPDIALFSAGSELSLKIAKDLTDRGSYVIDNSSAWRMHEGIPLVVPEVNGDLLRKSDHLIANPNCSTIQLVMVLKVIHDQFPIKRVVVSTYQSVSGSGTKAIEQLEAEGNGTEPLKFYPYRIDSNCIPHCDVFLENDYTKEEMKLVRETRKIMGISNLPLTATAVRVPVVGGHSESVNIEFEREYDLEEIRRSLSGTAGIQLVDEPKNEKYPMPFYVQHLDDVFVGRIRKDESVPHGLNMWIVADNIRKGAATNAVQIAEIITKKGFL